MSTPPPSLYQSGAAAQRPQRLHRPQQSAGGDGGFDANGALQMPQAPGANPMGVTHGQTTGQAPRFQTSHPPPAQTGGGYPPPTFAQMQSQGQARPAPPMLTQPPAQPGGGYPPPAQTGGGYPAPTQTGGGYPPPSAPSGGGIQPPAPPTIRHQYTVTPQDMSQYATAPSMSGGASHFGGSQPPPRPQYPSQQGGQATQGSVNDDLLDSVSQSLANPSAYGSRQVQDTYRMLQQSLGEDFDYQRKQLNDEMAKRGLSESTIAGQRYSDLATEQARAQSNMATQLANQAALTYGQDRLGAQNAALGAGQLGLGQGGLDLQRMLGLGNLGVAQQQADTGAQSVANQFTLGQGQLGLGQGGLDLQRELGRGNLGLAQQGQDLAKQLGLGNLGIAQQGQDLAKQLGLGNLDLSRQQLAQSGNQFQQQLGENSRQFNASNTLASQLGLGNLDLSRQQLAQSGSQFSQQLAQQLGLATMSDKTANRGIDAQGNQQLNQLLMQLALMGIGNGTTAGLGGFGGSSATGSGGAGGASNVSIPPGTDPYTAYLYRSAGTTTDRTKIDAAAQKLQSENPQMWAMFMLNSKDPNYAAYVNSPEKAINFSGQQYTPKEYLTLMAQHPEQFGVQKFGEQKDWNANWFKNSTQTSGTGQLATNQFPNAPVSPTSANQWTDRMPTFDEYLTTMQRNGASPQILAQLSTPASRHNYELTHTGDGSGQADYVRQFNATGDETRGRQQRSAADVREWLTAQGIDPGDVSYEDLQRYRAGGF